jgi:hypothetical protein
VHELCVYPADYLSDRFTHLERKVVFVVGSGLAMATSNTRGVPSASGIVELICQKLGVPPDSYGGEASSYHEAFEELRGRMPPDAINRLVREAVLEARTVPFNALDRENFAGKAHECARLGEENAGWDLAPGMVALGELLSLYPERFERVVLTSNFDPLIEVSLRRCGCGAIPVLCDRNTSLEPLRQQGTGVLVVHFHGSWTARNTLHLPQQLAAPRKDLEDSLRSLMSNSTVVVIGYSGWNDLFTRVLRDSLRCQTVDLDVLWCNYSNSKDELSRNEVVGEILQAQGSLSSVAFYMGVDANAVLPSIVSRLKSSSAPKHQPAAPALIFDVTRPERPSPCYLENRWGLDRGSKNGVLFLSAGKSSRDVRVNLASVESHLRFEAAQTGIDLPHREWVSCRPADLSTMPAPAANLTGAVCELEPGDLPTIALHLRSTESGLREGRLTLLLTSQFPADRDPLEHIARVRQAVKTLALDPRYLSYPLPIRVQEGAQDIYAWPGAECHELTDDHLQISRFTENPATFDESRSSRQLAAARSFVVGDTVAREFVRHANLTRYELALRLGLSDSLCAELLGIAGAESNPDIWWLLTRVSAAHAFMGTACRLPVKARAVLGLVSAAEWRSLSDFERESITEMRGGDPLNLFGPASVSGRIPSAAGD